MAGSEQFMLPVCPPPKVVVVGAGVSGCACAAVLADRGINVTLVHSALDRVNLPAYGPELVAGPRGWNEIEETLEMLPLPLRQAWLSSAALPETGVPVVIIDRRAVSIETKRALEGVPGLNFRQGLVTDLRLEPFPSEDYQGCLDPKEGRPVSVTVGTVFDESFGADAVVLAVGLGLGGRITVGEDALYGGRYGETPADGLRSTLEMLGVTFGEALLEVGACFVGDKTGFVGCLAEADPRHRRLRTIEIRSLAREDRTSELVFRQVGLDWARRVSSSLFPNGLSAGAGDLDDGEDAESSSNLWPGSYPPAVHWCEDLPMQEMIIAEGQDGVQVPLVSSDGRATAEIHVFPRGERALKAIAERDGDEFDANEGGQVLASRLHHVVRAEVVQCLGPDGRLTLASGETPPVWVVGRAAGASSYLDSLRSGAVTGAAVARTLLARSGEEECVDGPLQNRGVAPSAEGQGSSEPVRARGRRATRGSKR